MIASFQKGEEPCPRTENWGVVKVGHPLDVGNSQACLVSPGVPGPRESRTSLRLSQPPLPQFPRTVIQQADSTPRSVSTGYRNQPEHVAAEEKGEEARTKAMEKGQYQVLMP